MQYGLLRFDMDMFYIEDVTIRLSVENTPVWRWEITSIDWVLNKRKFQIVKFIPNQTTYYILHTEKGILFFKFFINKLNSQIYTNTCSYTYMYYNVIERQECSYKIEKKLYGNNI